MTQNRVEMPQRRNVIRVIFLDSGTREKVLGKQCANYDTFREELVGQLQVPLVSLQLDVCMFLIYRPPELHTGAEHVEVKS
jgi:hypothetical protein